AGWLAAVYQDLLGHGTATDPNAPIYLTQLNSGTPRSTIANTLVTGDEYLRRVIFTNYVNLVGRAPHDNADPAQSEFLALLPILKQTKFAPGGPSPDEQLINALVGSHEYFQHVGNTDRSWAASVYTKVLGRDPNALEVTNLLNAILDGYSGARQSAAAKLLATVEYKNRLVAGYYQGHLGRAASTAEINTWVSQMPPVTDDQVLANIVSSAEYFPLTGGGSSNSGWLDKLYNDLLKRGYNFAANNGQGEGFFKSTLDNTPQAQLLQARITTALSVLQSAEYRYILVATFFNKYLGKNKVLSASFNDPELTPYVNLLNAGASQEQIIAILIGLKDYALLTHAFP
ncbi:MAG TPA: hypothetical protein VE988_14575, partial [Gemmataceae bacterium]|nr:hypothetical protein [Gemmataceae bacterium]